MNVKSIVASSGKFSLSENGLLVVAEIQVGKVIANTIEVQRGVSIKDRITGEMYCAFMENGIMKTEIGNCEEEIVSQSTDNIEQITSEPDVIPESSSGQALNESEESQQGLDSSSTPQNDTGAGMTSGEVVPEPSPEVPVLEPAPVDPVVTP